MNPDATIPKPQSQIELSVDGQPLILRGDGSVLLPETEQLLIADLHLGKDASFRAAGVPVPPGVNDATFSLLDQAISETAAKEVLILGDLIHNRDSMTESLIERFAAWREQLDGGVHLVLGNHDRHAKRFPASWQLRVSNQVTIGNLYLCHEAVSDEADATGKIQIGGHWHPVATFGRGADSMRLPCFVVDAWQIILPAFGPFKGGMTQARKHGRRLFPIAQSKIWEA